MEEMGTIIENSESPIEKLLATRIRLSREVLFFAAIIILAFFSRFIDLESRVMSHDENTHVYFSWLLERGQGYTHDPLSHGPFQFHVVALSYFFSVIPMRQPGSRQHWQVWLQSAWCSCFESGWEGRAQQLPLS